MLLGGFCSVKTALFQKSVWEENKKMPSLAAFVFLAFDRNRFFVQLSVLTIEICNANVQNEGFMYQHCCIRCENHFLRDLLHSITQIRFAYGLQLAFVSIS